MKKQKADKKKSPKAKTPKVMPDVTEYIRLYKEENYPLREVAKHFKVSVSTIYNAMTAAGFKDFRAKSSRCNNKRMSMEQQAIALYESGMTRTAVVQKLGIAARTLNAIIEKNGLPLRRGIDPVTSANRAAQYNKAYNDYKLTLRETAELFGISHPIVLQELKRNGYPIRQNKDSRKHLKFRLKHKDGGIAGLFVPKLTPRQRERRQILLRIRQRREDKRKLKQLESYSRAQEYWQLVYEGGLEFEEVGQLFNVTGKTVERVIKSSGLDLKARKERLKAAALKEEEEIAQKYWELYNQPMSLDEVGSIFGLSDSTVRAVLLRHGYETRKRGRIFNSDRNEQKPRKPKKPKTVVVSGEKVVETQHALDLLISNKKAKKTEL
jgi:predicted DNA-binding protein YlxM (UPF0122 family)